MVAKERAAGKDERPSRQNLQARETTVEAWPRAGYLLGRLSVEAV